ncbi:altronate dehydratase [Clostridium sp. AF18-27]|uniref:UxaA family hydrolase n=2 Tax=Enterocloster lavalensis TaxID=460384 RepID=UPI000D1A835F|nr:altronate dehydratase family protein [Enterocloster lavalensis]MBS5605040.1 altronate dehydratase [Enterocloster asparagiformis]PST33326.1 altronate hydrolase [Enterocloster lavalensis]RHR53766.1 altronate dehydratase [Clostridium sp. AF18-27]
MQDIVKINQNDNVAVALRPIAAGETLQVGGAAVTTTEEIPQGHKFALRPIQAGEEVVKYGFRIGFAKEDIPTGSWVHVHNVKTGLGDVLSYTYEPAKMDVEPTEHAYFQGYRRADGKVGVRNEIWIIPTVGCVNSIAKALEARARDLVKGTVEDIIAFPHPYGCSQMGDDQENTRKVLADMIHHPNAGGVLVLGLGCENSNIPVLMDYIGEYDAQRVKFLQCQDVEDEMETAMEMLEELAEYAGAFSREQIDASELIIGMKCGGSDGLSGITANPVVGAFSDLLVSKGGTTILTEVPEMFGAETILMNRCETPELFEKTVDLINDFKNYFTSHNQTIYENPSPGNKKGGISTLEDKSLGCTQKSGSALVKGVLGYAEPVKVKGLNLLSAPGNDLVASTALAVSGAHIVLFTTGRGTPFASPVPTVKISSNSKLAGHKDNWIDFNAGRMVEDKTKEEMAQALFDYVLEVASGRKVKAEEAGFHDMAIFKQGVTL